MSSRLRLVAIAVAVALPFAGLSMPAYADGPAHGSLRLEFSNGEPAVGADVAPNDEFDAAGTLSGVVNNVKIDPKDCRVSAPSVASLASGAASLAASCGGTDLALRAVVDPESGSAATGLSLRGGDTGDGDVAAVIILIIICDCGTVIVIIIW